MKKYKFTDESIEFEGRKLFRIEALRDFGDIKCGDLGGFVECFDNLSQSQYGDAWVCDNANVYGNAMVCGNALVLGNAKVYGNAKVFDDARVCGNVSVYGDAKVFGDAMVCDDAKVYDNAKVCGNAKVYDNAKVYGDAWVYGDVGIYDDVEVYGEAAVNGKARLGGNAKVCSSADYIVFKNWWSSGRYFTWTRSNNMWRVGCFYGTGAELVKKAYSDSEESGIEYERVVDYVEDIIANKRKHKKHDGPISYIINSLHSLGRTKC